MVKPPTTEGLSSMCLNEREWMLHFEKKTKRETSLNQRTIYTLLNVTDDAVFLIDKGGTFLALNKSLSNRLSKDTEELLGMRIYNFLSPDLAILRKK